MKYFMWINLWQQILSVEKEWQIWGMMLTNADWCWLICWLVLIYADWCWLVLTDADWCWLICWFMCWLVLINADFCWLMLVDKVQPGFLQSFSDHFCLETGKTNVHFNGVGGSIKSYVFPFCLHLICHEKCIQLTISSDFVDVSTCTNRRCQ